MGESLRPRRIVIYKSSVDPTLVQPWIYRVQTDQNCTRLYNTPSGTTNVVSIDSKLCQVYLTGPQPLNELVSSNYCLFYVWQTSPLFYRFAPLPVILSKMLYRDFSPSSQLVLVTYLVSLIVFTPEWGGCHKLSLGTDALNQIKKLFASSAPLLARSLTPEASTTLIHFFITV